MTDLDGSVKLGVEVSVNEKAVETEVVKLAQSIATALTSINKSLNAADNPISNLNKSLSTLLKTAQSLSATLKGIDTSKLEAVNKAAKKTSKSTSTGAAGDSKLGDNAGEVATLTEMVKSTKAAVNNPTNSDAAYVDSLLTLKQLEAELVEAKKAAIDMYEPMLNKGPEAAGYLGQLQQEYNELNNSVRQFKATGAGMDDTEYMTALERMQQIRTTMANQSSFVNTSDDASLKELDTTIAKLTADLTAFNEAHNTPTVMTEAEAEFANTLQNEIAILQGRRDAITENTGVLGQLQQEYAQVSADFKARSIFMSDAEYQETDAHLKELSMDIANLKQALSGSYDATSISDLTKQYEYLEAAYTDLTRRSQEANGGTVLFSPKEVELAELLKSQMKEISAEISTMREAEAAEAAEKLKNTDYLGRAIQEYNQLNAAVKEYEKSGTGMSSTEYTQDLQRISELKRTISNQKLFGSVDDTTSLKQLQSLLESLQAEADKLRTSMTGSWANGSAADAGVSERYHEVANQITQVQDRINALNANKVDPDESKETADLNKMGNAATSAAAKMRSAFGSAAKSALSTLGKRVVSVTKNIGKMALGAVKAAAKVTLLGKLGNSSGAGMEKGFKKALTTVLKLGFGVRGVFALVRKLRTSVITAYKELATQNSTVNSELSSFMTNLNQVKASLATAFQPIASVVIPILNRLMSALSSALNSIGSFIAAFTGQNVIYKATATQVDYAASAEDAASAADDATDAVEGELGAYDKLNVIGQDSSDSGSDGGSSGSTPTATYSESSIPSAISDLVQNIKDAFNNEDWDFFENLGATLAQKLADALNSIPWDGIQEAAYKIAMALSSFLNGFLGSTEMWQAIGHTLAQGLNTALIFLTTMFENIHWKDIASAFTEGLNTLVAELDFSKLGEIIAAPLSILIQTLDGFFTTFDFGAFGTKLSEAVNSFVSTIQSALDSVDTLQWGTNASELFNKFFANWDATATATMLSDIVKKIFDLIIGLVEGTDWGLIGTKIWEFISGIDWSGLRTRLYTLLGDLLGAGLSLLFTVLSNLGQQIWQYICDTFTQTINDAQGTTGIWGVDLIIGIFNGIVEWIKDIGTWIYDNILSPFIEGFKKTFSIGSPAKEPSIVELGSYLIQGVFNGILEWLSNIGTWIQDNILTPFKNKWDEALTIVSTWGTNVVAKIVEIWTNIKTWLSNTIGAIKDNIKSKFDLIKTTITEKLTAVKTKVTEIWNNIKTAFTDKITAIKTGVVEKFTAIKTAIVDKITAAKTTLSTVLENIKSKFSSIFEGAKTIVSNAINFIKGLFNFSWSLPDIKLPHFSIQPTGWTFGDLVKGSIPSLGISWYAKGGVVDGASLIGAGEAGAEAIVPLEKNTGWLNEIAERLASLISGESTVSNIASAIDRLTTAVSNVPVILGNIATENLPGIIKGSVLPSSEAFLTKLVAMSATLEEIKDSIEFLAEKMDSGSGNHSPIVLQLNGKAIAQVTWDETSKRYKQTGSYPF